MVWLKSCPRCSAGDLILEDGREECSVKCVQCGYVKYVDNPAQAATAMKSLTLSLELTARLA